MGIDGPPNGFCFLCSKNQPNTNRLDIVTVVLDNCFVAYSVTMLNLKPFYLDKNGQIVEQSFCMYTVRMCCFYWFNNKLMAGRGLARLVEEGESSLWSHQEKQGETICICMLKKVTTTQYSINKKVNLSFKNYLETILSYQLTISNY